MDAYIQLMSNPFLELNGARTNIVLSGFVLLSKGAEERGVGPCWVGQLRCAPGCCSSDPSRT